MRLTLRSFALPVGSKDDWRKSAGKVRKMEGLQSKGRRKKDEKVEQKDASWMEENI